MSCVLLARLTRLWVRIMACRQCVILTRRQSSERHKLWRPITFFALLALSFFARVIWFFLRAAGSNNFGDHIVNRIALLAFFGCVAVCCV